MQNYFSNQGLKGYFVAASLLSIISCKKAVPKGEVVLDSEFSDTKQWELYSEYSAEDSVYTKIDGGLLMLNTYTTIDACQRATHFISGDYSIFSEIRLAIYFKKLILPSSTALHIYCSIGSHEFRAVIERSEHRPFTLWIRLKNENLWTNLRGVVFDQTTAKIESDQEYLNFVQITLCGSNLSESTQNIYTEIDRLILTVQ
ncbi:MAG: hypothetical protein IPM74_07995 [Crocinitomicaceae bacterium]|nr:hypothetical protein [Crocinitomicaceae bacterium]MBK8925839.1 hypothetical protein [Crocinitomicaceae bacterium]